MAKEILQIFKLFMSQKIFCHIVTFNNENSIITCLNSCFNQQGFTLGENLFIKVTDNLSSDKTLDILKKTFHNQTGFEVQQNKINLGFSKAHNEALGQASGFDYFLIANPDLFLTESALSKLLEAAACDPFCGIATPKLYRAADNLTPLEPRIIDSAGMYITPAIRHFDRGSGQLESMRFEKFEYVFGATGALMLIKAECYRDLARQRVTSDCPELFDEAFFAYREDADLAWRMHYLGWKCLYVPNAIGYHVRKVLPHRRKSLPEFINKLGVQNRFLLQLNNFLLPANYHCILPTLCRNLLVLAATLLVERSSLSALKDVMALAPSALAKRRQILQKRFVPYFEISKWFSFTPFSELALSPPITDTRFTSLRIIVVNYNSGENLMFSLLALNQALPHISKQIPNIKLIVIDNASTDSSEEAVKHLDDSNICFKLEFRKNEANLGFAGAINLATSDLDEDALLILNPDIEINEQAIISLFKCLEKYTNLGAISPVLKSPNNEIQTVYCLRNFPSISSALAELFFLHRIWPNNPWTSRYYRLRDTLAIEYLSNKVSRLFGFLQFDFNVPIPVEQPAAACLMINSNAFKKLGGFDAGFFPAYFEDVDFCKRLRKEGFIAGVLGAASVRHEGGYSKHSSPPFVHALRWYPNLRRYIKKHYSIPTFVMFDILLRLALLLRGGVTFAMSLLPNSNQSADYRRLSSTLIRLSISPKPRNSDLFQVIIDNTPNKMNGLDNSNRVSQLK